jgi:hypothetical protein
VCQRLQHLARRACASVLFLLGWQCMERGLSAQVHPWLPQSPLPRLSPIPAVSRAVFGSGGDSWRAPPAPPSAPQTGPRLPARNPTPFAAVAMETGQQREAAPWGGRGWVREQLAPPPAASRPGRRGPESGTPGQLAGGMRQLGTRTLPWKPWEGPVPAASLTGEGCQAGLVVPGRCAPP